MAGSTAWPSIDETGRLLLVISGPSGAGKSSLIHHFRQRRDDFVQSVSATTRAPRAGERDGVDYHFLSDEDFRRHIANGDFLEYAQVFGKHFYGTPRAFVERQFAAGQHVVMDIDVQGATQIRSRMPEAVLVFVVPPDRDELERRLNSRGTEDPEARKRRLAEAERELACWHGYDYLVINDTLGAAAERLDLIVGAEHLRVRRQ